MAVILRRLLGIGRLPGDMRAQVEADGVIHLAEFVPVTMRFTGRVPGRVSVGKKRGYVGALALTTQRVLGTLSTLPGKAGRAIDQPWTPPLGGMANAIFDEGGLHIEIPDLSTVDPEFGGAFSLHFKEPLKPEVLRRLPTRTITFDVPPKYVNSALGIPRG